MGAGGSGEAGAGPVLALFAKAPRPGMVKTRLCPPLRPAEAAGLYAGWLRELLRPVAGVRTCCFGWPAEALAELAQLAADGVELHPQQGDGLWPRMANCFRTLFAAGHDRVVLRGTDSPDVPAEAITTALRQARPDRVVLGPDAGGGFYLIGLAAPCPHVDRLLAEPGGLPGQAFSRVVARARSLGLEVVDLPLGRDVDTHADLQALWRERDPG